jgi:nucleoid-associated protein YgaU
MKRLALLMTVAGVVVLYTGGCDSSEELKFLQEKNQKLTQRVEDLEDQLESVQRTNQTLTRRVAELGGQLRQAEAIASTPKTDTQPFTAGPTYIVVEGDSLWNIAEKQFGDGNLYTEILALNPHIKEDKPLAIGTKLIMPSR